MGAYIEYSNAIHACNQRSRQMYSRCIGMVSMMMSYCAYPIPPGEGGSPKISGDWTLDREISGDLVLWRGLYYPLRSPRTLPEPPTAAGIPAQGSKAPSTACQNPATGLLQRPIRPRCKAFPRPEIFFGHPLNLFAPVAATSGRLRGDGFINKNREVACWPGR